MAQKIDGFENQKRNKMVGIKLTQDEFAELGKHCDEIGVTKSRYFRFLYTEALAQRKKGK